MRIDGEQAAALGLIVGASEGRHRRACLDAIGWMESVGSRVAMELAAAELVVVWEARDPALVTLTPLAAEVLGVELAEHWEPDGAGGWYEAEHWEPADSRAWGDRDSRPVRLPRHGREVPIPTPELVPDHRPGPEYLIDEVSESPVLLFGQPIPREAPQRHTKGPRRAG